MREQVEKVLGAALFAEDLSKWMPRMLEDGWARQYQAFLDDRYEVGHLERQASFFASREAELEEQRCGMGVPPEMKEFLDLMDAGQSTAHLAAFKPFAHRLPTPKSAWAQVQDPDRYACLERWYREYAAACSFSHVLLQKIVLGAIQRDGSFDHILDRDGILRRKAEHVLTVSWTATAYALTDLNASVLGYDLGVLEAADAFWNALKDGSFLGRTVWDLHARKLMPGSELGSSL